MAVTTEYVNKMKRAAGITAAFYEEDILDKIDAARKDLIRIGVLESAANDESNSLVTEAIKTYIKSKYAESEAEAARLTECFNSFKADLSLSEAYRVDPEAVI